MIIKKEVLLKVLAEFPEEFSLDDLLEKLLFVHKVERGLEQSKKGQVISDEEIQRHNLAFVFALPRSQRLQVLNEIISSLEGEEKQMDFEPSPELLSYLNHIYERVKANQMKIYDEQTFWKKMNQKDDRSI